MTELGDAVARVLRGERAEHVVPAVLASMPQLDNAGRRRVALRVYGTSIFRITLAYLTGVEIDARHAETLVDAYVHFVEERATPSRPWPTDPVERVVVERSCPRPIVDALSRSFALADVDRFLAASNVPGPKVLRANTLKCTRAALQERLRTDAIDTDDGTIAASALVVDEHASGRVNLFGSGAWRDGWFEVQDQASQFVAEACRAKPGDVVVDLCAGRGGKTLALAASMQNRGTVHVHDVDERALADMQPRLRRAGVACVRRGLPMPRTADVVLVDAPCSSIGVLRRSPDLRFTFDPSRDLPRLVETQRALHAQAFELVKPGGRVVFAVCSVLADEFARDDRVPADDDVVLSPHVHGCDGFYVASFIRR